MSIESALHSTPATHHRFHILDALRGIAAIFVVCWHVTARLYPQRTQSSYLAVDFFFCLSGFVIAFSYERRLASSLTFRKFILARMIRLYPVYFLGCLLGTCILVTVKTPFHLLPHLLTKLLLLLLFQFAMLPNLHIWMTRSLFPLDGPSWSMFFEIVANAGYAAFLRRRLARTFVLVSLYLLSFALMSRWAWTHSNIDVGWLNSTSDIGGGLARVTLSFTAGVLILRIYRAVPHPGLPRFASAFAAITIAAALALLLLTPFAIMRAKAFQLLTVTIFFPALVYFGSICKAPQSWTSTCAFLGDISYPMYLLQYFVITIIASLPFEMRLLREHPRADVAVLPAVLSITTAVSFAAARYFDAPVRAFLTRKFNPRPALKAESLPS